MPVAPVHAVALAHPVDDPGRTAAVLVGALGFQWRKPVDAAEPVVENGALAIRLVSTADRAGGAARPLELDVETDDLDGGFEAIRRRATVTRAGEARWLAADRAVRRIELEGGIAVTLIRTLSEDDLHLLPPLPAALDWDEASDLLVRRVLRAVPLPFRDAARRRVTRCSEAVALEAGRVEVDVNAAVLGLAEVTPEYQYEELALALLAEGVELPSLPEASRDRQLADHGPAPASRALPGAVKPGPGGGRYTSM